MNESESNRKPVHRDPAHRDPARSEPTTAPRPTGAPSVPHAPVPQASAPPQPADDRSSDHERTPDIRSRPTRPRPGADPPTGGPSVFDQPVVRMRTPADIAEALPYLLGFHPSESVVVLGIRGPGRTQGGTVRIDIPAVEAWPAAARELARFLVAVSDHREQSPESVVLYLCRDPEPAPGTADGAAPLAAEGGPGRAGAAVRDSLRPLHRELVAAFAAEGVPVAESLCLSAGRWYSFTCFEPGCCPVEGTPVPLPGAASPLAAAAAVAGLRLRGTLRDLQRALEPSPGTVSDSQIRLYESELAAFAAELTASADTAAVRERTCALLERAIAAFQAGAETIPDAEAIRLLLGLQDRQARDRAAEWIDPPEAAAAARLWRHLARRCAGPLDRYAVAPLSLLAWTAWVRGDLPVARVALVRALTADPDYTFASLVYEAVNSGVLPDELCAALRRERRARQARVSGAAAPATDAGAGSAPAPGPGSEGGDDAAAGPPPDHVPAPPGPDAPTAGVVLTRHHGHRGRGRSQATDPVAAPGEQAPPSARSASAGPAAPTGRAELPSPDGPAPALATEPPADGSAAPARRRHGAPPHAESQGGRRHDTRRTGHQDGCRCARREPGDVPRGHGDDRHGRRPGEPSPRASAALRPRTGPGTEPLAGAPELTDRHGHRSRTGHPGADHPALARKPRPPTPPAGPAPGTRCCRRCGAAIAEARTPDPAAALGRRALREQPPHPRGSDSGHARPAVYRH